MKTAKKKPKAIVMDDSSKPRKLPKDLAKKAKQSLKESAKSKSELPKGIKPIRLLTYTREMMKIYGMATIEDRALVDYRDGLKPVQRKILWSMFDTGLLSNTSHRKSARTVGDVIGRFHPHGDAAAYGSMVNMANSPTPMVDGEGNWGSMTDNAAAMRYTNARLSKYGHHNFFNENLRNVMQFVPNYDDKETEPLILNSVLPNVLINGTEGIAVGVTSKTPSFSVESVVALLRKIFTGEAVTGRLLAETLVYNYAYGGKCTTPKKELARGYEKAAFSVDFASEYTQPKNNQMLFHSFAPGLNVEGRQLFLQGIEKKKKKESVKKKKKKMPVYCNDFVDQSYKDKKLGKKVYLFMAKLSKDQSKPENVEKIEYEMSSTLHFKINLTERYRDELGNSKVRFFSCSFIELIQKWCEWRVQVESESLAYQIKKVLEKVVYTELLVLAGVNRKIIIQALESKDPRSVISKKLKITEKEADTILDLQVRKLSKLDENQLRDKLKELGKQLKVLNGYLKNPKAKILEDLKAFKI